MNANATTALETVLKNSAERPLLSMIVADRAVCRVKCSVVRAWSSRWSPLTANARSPVSGPPDCPAAWMFAMAPPHESGSIHRPSVMFNHPPVGGGQLLLGGGGWRRPEPVWREPWQQKARSRPAVLTTVRACLRSDQCLGLEGG